MKKTLMPHKCPECGKWSRLEYVFSEIIINEDDAYPKHYMKFIAITCKHCKTRVSIDYGNAKGVWPVRLAKKIIVKKFTELHKYIKN